MNEGDTFQRRREGSRETTVLESFGGLGAALSPHAAAIASSFFRRSLRDPSTMNTVSLGDVFAYLREMNSIRARNSMDKLWHLVE